MDDFEAVVETPERPRGPIIGAIVGGAVLLCLCVAGIVVLALGQGGFLGAGDALDTTGGGTVAFEVEDLDRLIGELRGKDVKFTTEVIAGPKCRMIVCRDSERNAILLHQHEPG